MPKIVQPAPHDHASTGEGHDLPDLGPVFLAVAVDMAVFARRLRLKGTPAALFHRIGHERTTVRAEGNILAARIAVTMEILCLVSMYCCAINPDKGNQNLQILALFMSKLFHMVHHTY